MSPPPGSPPLLYCTPHLILFTLGCSSLVTDLSPSLSCEVRASHNCVSSTTQHKPEYTAGVIKCPRHHQEGLPSLPPGLSSCLRLFLTQPSPFIPSSKDPVGRSPSLFILSSKAHVGSGFPVLATSDGLQAQDEGSEVVRSNITRAGLGLGRRGGGSEEMQLPRQECSRMEDGG